MLESEREREEKVQEEMANQLDNFIITPTTINIGIETIDSLPVHR